MIILYVLRKLKTEDLYRDTDSDYPGGTYTWNTESGAKQFRESMPYKDAIQYEVIVLLEKNGTVSNKVSSGSDDSF
jgi:hypothetical protein